MAILFLFLLVITTTAYWRVGTNEFIDLDDNAYVTENHHVRQGLTFENFKWSFSFNNTDYWLPLTWISHMLDCSLFGLNAGMHHRTSLLIHIVNGMLLFLFLNKTTGTIWKSAVVAVLFSLHPINVDSVAWIAERKNVLSSLFWMLTLLAYSRYVEHPNIKNYLVILVPFILGSMAKPMLVTMPFVLLLLDYWPLGRFSQSASTKIEARPSAIRFYAGMILDVKRLAFEKIPLFALSCLSIVITSLSLRKLGHLISNDIVPMKLRLANALISYVRYIGKAIWPFNFSIHYPYPTEMYPAWQLAAAAFLLMGITVGLIHQMGKRPYLIIGWLWFMGTFVPAIGLTFSGTWGAINDRFAYIPLIGLYIVLVWGSVDAFGNGRLAKKCKVAISTIYILILSALTWLQVGHWKNSEMLFEHALSVTTDNYFVHNLLGVSLSKQGKISSAIEHFQKSIRIRPSYFEAYNNLGIEFSKIGKPDDALQSFSSALQLCPTLASAHNNMGNILAEEGKTDAAEKRYIRAIQLRPDYFDAYNNLGILYYHQRKFRKAMDNFQHALRVRPDFEGARANLELARRQFSQSK